MIVDDDLKTLAALKEPAWRALCAHPGVSDVRWQPTLSKAAEDLLLAGQFALEAEVTLVDEPTADVYLEARVDLGYPADRRTIEGLYVQEAVYRAASAAGLDVQSVMGWPLRSR